MPTLYQRLGLRPFINARGTITTLGGSIMPAPVVEAMAEAARQFRPSQRAARKGRCSHRRAHRR